MGRRLTRSTILEILTPKPPNPYYLQVAVKAVSNSYFDRGLPYLGLAKSEFWGAQWSARPAHMAAFHRGGAAHLGRGSPSSGSSAQLGRICGQASSLHAGPHARQSRGEGGEASHERALGAASALDLLASAHAFRRSKAFEAGQDDGLYESSSGL